VKVIRKHLAPSLIRYAHSRREIFRKNERGAAMAVGKVGGRSRSRGRYQKKRRRAERHRLTERIADEAARHPVVVRQMTDDEKARAQRRGRA